MIKYYVLENEKRAFDDADIIRVPKGVEVKNAVVAIENSARRTYCVFDEAGEPVPASFPEDKPLPQKSSYANFDYYDDVAIFCGQERFFHFGHFLMEGLERVWPILSKKYKNAKLVFVTKHETMPKFVADFLKLLGVSEDRVIMLNKSAKFRVLYVPERAAWQGTFTSEMQKNVYQEIAKNAEGKTFGDKIYLSRSRLGSLSIFGEVQIQRIFEKNGFTVIYPETLSVEEQVRVAAGAKCIAGIAGSALHLSVFMKPGGHVIQLNRACHSSNVSAQYVLCRSADADLTVVAASVDTKQDAGHLATVPHIVGVTPYLKQFFDENGFKYDETDIELSKEELEKYSIALRKYLRGHGVGYKLKKFLVKMVSCFVPGYKKRRAVRHWMEEKFNLEK